MEGCLAFDVCDGWIWLDMAGTVDTKGNESQQEQGPFLVFMPL